MKTIMVFGATGLLGAYISLHFHGKGWKVIAVGRRKSDNGFFAGYFCRLWHSLLFGGHHNEG